MPNTLFHSFQSNIAHIPLPEKFTFPFYYEPHELSIIAAKELQNYLETQTDFKHNFGLEDNQTGMVIGKMFGVLVVQNSQKELGYLAAFSGKLAESNHLTHFVPTVFDMLEKNSFFKKSETLLNELNAQIDTLENSIEYKNAIIGLKEVKNNAAIALKTQKEIIKVERKNRAILRKLASTEEQEQLNAKSQSESILLKKMTQYWNYKITDATTQLESFSIKINELKHIRKTKSAEIQKQLFDNYAFLNQYGKLKSLGEIFNQNPPAGAGECAAPKLLQYAFQNELKPIAMAEFWWGQSPKSEIRKHQNFYAACTGKCQPILAHMLEGMAIEDNPLTTNLAEKKKIKIVFEDDYLIIVNKPSELLSVPGKQINDSVYSRIKKDYPTATGPLVVHRLDMATSGILLIAKSSEIHKKLQLQFINRQIKKRYIALLDGILKETKGTVNLPLRVDLDNRPNQIVCYEYGKEAQTQWEVVEQKNGQTKVYFYPITGRTHQLRVHAAHQLGLQCPILGDDLYGKKADRLYLHAESITFKHPISREIMTVSVEAHF